MHPHGNPNGECRERPHCNAALQIKAGSPGRSALAVRGARGREKRVVQGIDRTAPSGRCYRRTVLGDSSAELLAASASSAEISAVWAGVPQLGASLPSPQARGR